MERTTDGPRVLIVGAARWMAQSARRAGFVPLALDRFGDRDLMAAAPGSMRVDEWADGVVAAAARWPGLPVCYTGPLENHAEIVEALARDRPLWGNSPEVLRAVRDPLRLARVLRVGGFAVPESRRDPAGLPADGSWLEKPVASCGGLGIRPWRGILHEDAPEPVYYQRRVRGRARGVLYLARPGRDCELMGWSVSLRGAPGAAFAYRGSIGPLAMAPAQRARLTRMGRALVRAFGLRGLFGVDVVVDAGEQPWVVELNPRPPASAELFEADGTIFSAHASTFGAAAETSPRIGDERRPDRSRCAMMGKEVVYATTDCSMPDAGKDDMDREWDGGRGFAPLAPRIGDVPTAGSVFSRGEPVLTVYARGRRDPARLRSLLAGRVRWWLRRLAATGRSDAGPSRAVREGPP